MLTRERDYRPRWWLRYSLIQLPREAGQKNMMGHRQVEPAALFCEVSLERHIPTDHFLRSIDRFVELGELRRGLTAQCYLDGYRLLPAFAVSPNSRIVALNFTNFVAVHESLRGP